MITRKEMNFALRSMIRPQHVELCSLGANINIPKHMELQFNMDTTAVLDTMFNYTKFEIQLKMEQVLL